MSVQHGLHDSTQYGRVVFNFKADRNQRGRLRKQSGTVVVPSLIKMKLLICQLVDHLSQTYELLKSQS